MGVLSRYDESGDESVPPPAPRAGLWRYDATSEEASSSAESENSGCLEITIRSLNLKLTHIILKKTFYIILLWQMDSTCPPSTLRSGSSSSSTGPRSSTVDLRLTAIQSMHGLQEEGDQSTFAENGMDPKRIKNVLKSSSCDCGNECTLPYKVLLKTCQTFWGLPKECQDSLLWSLQSATGRKTWKIEG